MRVDLDDAGCLVSVLSGPPVPIADGDRVIVRDGGAVWNPESGQSLFDFSVADLAAKTAPLVHRAADEARDQETTADHWFELACELEMSSIESAKDAYERALAMPGVQSASLGYMEPWNRNASQPISVPGSTVEPPWTMFDFATPEYLRTFGVRMK